MNQKNFPTPFSISKEKLLEDVYHAYLDARKNKRSRIYQLEFELNLENNLIKLRDELHNRQYYPSSSKCFIIHDPKMREIFAASFRDRIVHHLLYNYIHQLFERIFIYDCYSCIKGRGTHFGIKRLEHHIRSVSNVYTTPCYILKLDIKGYFMSINRKILLSICQNKLLKFKHQLTQDNVGQFNINFDFGFINWLLEMLVMLNPVDDCKIIGNINEWKHLPKEKSLFGTDSDCGLPIGNLTSQLFSNIYLNELDQYVKRKLKCCHYGRYVDDTYFVSSDRSYLKSLIPLISCYLSENLGLKINESKTEIFNAYHGVPFLGSYLLPYRNYVENSTLKRICSKLSCCVDWDNKTSQSRINSYLGVMSHYRCFCLRKCLFYRNDKLKELGRFSEDYLKFIPFQV